MATLNDLTGQKFGKLLVVKRDESKKGGAAYWLCKCDCGNEELFSARGSNLKNGQTSHCRKCKKENFKPKIDTTSALGKIFGRLTVIERDLNKPIGHGHGSYWICKCECGNTISANLASLNRGRIKSCGCLRSELVTKRNTLDLTNQRFGKLIALENTNKLSNHHSYYWKCRCDCGNIKEISAEDLKSGNVNSCGQCVFSSKGEKIINDILIENNISFIREVKFSDLKDKGYLRYDFAILDNNNEIIRLIEYDGIQHFKFTDFFYEEENDFKQRQYKDFLKNQYAKNKNIPLVRIPYAKINEINLEILMGDQYLIK